MTKNEIERAKMIACMEFICRQINDEDVFEGWLMCGVADGDIEYGNLDYNSVPEEYLEPDTFSDIMSCFLCRMNGAYKSGGLYCGGVVCESKDNM